MCALVSVCFCCRAIVAACTGLQYTVLRWFAMCDVLCCVALCFGVVCRSIEWHTMQSELCCLWVCVASWYMVVCGVRCVVRGMWFVDPRVWRVLCGDVWCGVVWCGVVWCGVV